MNDSNKNNTNNKWLKFSKSNLPILIIFVIQAPIFIIAYFRQYNMNYIPIWLAILIAASIFYFIYIMLKQSNKLKRIFLAIILSILIVFSILYIDLTITNVVGAFLYKG